MMVSLKAADLLPLWVAGAVALAAILGGAFFPGQRLAIGVLLAILLGWFASRRRTLSLTSDEWVPLALIGWGAVSATVAGMSPLFAKEVVTGWLVAWCLWMAARRAEPKTVHMAAMVLIAAAILVVVGIGLETVARAEIRVGGLLENPNIAAALIVTTLPLLSLFRNGSGHRWLVLFVMILVGGVALTGSRAGLLAILAAGGVLLPRDRTRIVGLVVGAGSVTAILVWRFVSQPDVLAWFRPAIWSAMLRLWTGHPLVGVGPGGLVDAAGPVRLLHDDHVGQHQFLATYAESSFIGLLVQTGLVGILIAVAAFALWLRRAGRGGNLSFAPLRSVVIGMALMAAFHDFLIIDIVVWWWALSLGLIEAAGGRPGREFGRPPNVLSVRFVRGLILALIVLWGIVQPAWARWLWRTETKDTTSVARTLAAEPWYDHPLEWQARSLLDQPTWTWETAAEALGAAREAVRVHPGASRLWVILGQVNYRIVTEFGPWPDSVAEARAAFERASELEPYQPWPWLEWARFERGLGNLDEAALLVRRALNVEPHAIRARLFLARVELDRGNVRTAREALESARVSLSHRNRSGLKTYEEELLAVPMWQFREIEEALR